MRIYQISKELGVPSKELIELLVKNNFDVSTHMTALSEKAVTFLRDHFKKASKKAKPKNEVQAKEVSRSTKEEAPLKKEKIQKQEIIVPEVKPIDQIIVEPMLLSEAAKRMKKPASELILTLLRQGIVCAKNQILTEELVEKLAHLYHFQPIKPEKRKEQEERIPLVEVKEAEERLPIIVIVGHVDHGKTTLLDYIRKTKVAAKEKGGITQHLGAYEVETPHGGIIFLDTPGHEAFYKIRGRGVKIADIAILVVAADDGVMPQTIEAIRHAQAVGVPVIVAINKIDKVPPAQIEKVKQQLTQYDLLPEEWGGEVVCVPISAKLGQGIDQLLEMIILQSQLLELKASKKGPAKGFVLESKLEKGRGPVATIICQQGLLRVGDYFVANDAYGKVSSLVDSYGKRRKKVGPSVPVQVAGFSHLPDAGKLFEVVSTDEYKKIKASRGKWVMSLPKKAKLESTINLIIKTDTKSSKEALLGAIEKLSEKTDRDFYITRTAIGDITEGDVDFASIVGAHIFGLHVKIETNALALAQKEGVSVKLYQVIYKLLDELGLMAKQPEEVILVPTKIGEAEVRKVFNIKGVGAIAGSYVRDGRFSREGRVVIWRANEKVGEGKIKSLERERKPVKEVHTGFECAFLIDGFNEWEVGDRVECFIDLPAQ